MANLEDLPIREDLRGRKPYGAPQLRVPISLNVNENTHRIPEPVAVSVVAAIAEAVLEINRYPDREFLKLRSALANYLDCNLTEANVWAANGSNEVLMQIFQAFGGPGRSALSFAPTYSMYPLLAQTTATNYLELKRGERFELTEDLVCDAIAKHEPDIVILCSPNNPTGTPLDRSIIEAAYAATSAVVVIDEAYAEFAEEDSALDLLAGRERLLISRTMSKAFAFAGARVGYLAADSAAVDALRLVRLPYHLSALTQAAALAALSHADLMLAQVADIRYQRNRMSLQLKELGFDPYRSAANFVLFGNLASSKDSFEQLLAEGILVRDVGIVNTLRVSAGTESETSAFLRAAENLTKL